MHRYHHLSIDQKLDLVIDLLLQERKLVMTKFNDLAVKAAQVAKNESDAFVAYQSADKVKFDALSAQIAALQVGEPVSQADLDGLNASLDSMSATNSAMTAAAVLTGTTAAPDVPAAAAASVPA